ncbi:ornithine decarboxylase antizyme 1-like [Tropilaelaps mercedesae]|uniref:Ornithine decarboxylase antizyme n=1 Tax=Tropilaelaps mercedesae TaxID=418985 RepID=A0A1V9X5D7_9ACAR|nr:ornithine decarboxylase antizyme 1-like [Tropilaelaps mercedesae]
MVLLSSQKETSVRSPFGVNQTSRASSISAGGFEPRPAIADASGEQCVGSGESHPVGAIVDGPFGGHLADNAGSLRSTTQLLGPGEKENDGGVGGASGGGAVWITFQVRDSLPLWEAVLMGRNLLLSLPDEGLPEGTKQAITELLEFAEEQLHVSAVIVSLNKQRSDRATVIRTLMYLGFESLAPGNQLVPSEMQDPQLYFMAYTI